jgi:ATP-binding cassette, subfamily B, bacterial
MSLRHILRRFWPQIRSQREVILGASLAMLGEVAFRLIEPWPLKFVFDHIIGAAAGQEAWTIQGMDTQTLLILAATAVVVATGLRAASSYLATVGFALAGNRIMCEVRRLLFVHVQRLSLKYHSKARRGDMLSRMTSDVQRMQDVVVSALLPLVSHVLTLVGMIALMLVINVRLGLLALAVVPLFVLASVRIGTRIRQVARKQRQQEGQLATTAAETINAIKVVQAYGLEESQEAAFAKQNKASLKEGVKGARLAAGLERSTDLIIAIGTASVLWYGATLVLEQRLTPGDLIVFLAYLKNAFKPMRDTAKFTGRLAKAAASGERIIELLDTAPEIGDRPGAVEAPGAVEMLALEGVGFSYERGHPVLVEFSLESQRGDRIAIVGPSGAGKSTVLNLLLRLAEPDSGRITINGQPISEMTLRSLRQRTAIVLQESILFAGSVRDNIALGRARASEAEIVAAAKAAGAHEFISALPRGYDTVVGERGETLSGGQRQRIALARAAVRGAPILVLDEPTTGLDQRSKEMVVAALERLAEDRITIVISHDLAAAERADRIIYMEQGRIVEQGTHEQLLSRPGRYAAMWALQAGSDAEEAHADAR